MAAKEGVKILIRGSRLSRRSLFGRFGRCSLPWQRGRRRRRRRQRERRRRPAPAAHLPRAVVIEVLRPQRDFGAFHIDHDVPEARGCIVPYHANLLAVQVAALRQTGDGANVTHVDLTS